MKAYYCLIFFFIMFLNGQAQDIVQVIDDLTIRWDQEAVLLKSYDGIEKYCREKPYRDNVVHLLDLIHHYDTLLYQIVTNKFESEKDPEAKATLDDIEELEVDYTTRSFLKFLRMECTSFNNIEMNANVMEVSELNRDREALETEQTKYVEAITAQIDLIDEHVHHLKGL